MNVLDVLLLIAAVAAAVSGFQRGLIAGVVSLAGFVGGASLGVWLLPFFVDELTPGSVAATVVALLVVLVPAAVGQALAWPLALRLRDAVSWAPGRWLDGAGGAVFNAVGVLLVAWIAASALVPTPSPGLNREVQGSALLGAVQDRMPEQAPTWFSRATHALSDAGFPQVFNPFENDPTVDVPPPSGDNVTEAASVAAEQSTVKINASSGFSSGQEGSGFVYAPERVVTNAHVVDGASVVVAQVGGVGQRLEAEVLLLDPNVDVAVLAVPGLQAPVLELADDASRGDPAVVAGYPENGGLDLRAATVASRTNAQGQDIHGQNVVTRDIYAVRGLVRPGNSGGPLLTTEGQVYGMVFARSVTHAETGYVLTADQIRPHLEQAG
ncbi:Colicin V production protein [Streptomyces zhaozhouensis]|uniref:Colicin V production protein n=1 Tax=Streptomyces zhaozhouensis TaxID=1300267 RepID=A0A286DX82_9ACTN|nr:MarP family serine protease [Streptomyces zhaozhouensis]SOD63164.1 Colicin V production protein [Streptomyces zhaozhouensis]